MEKKLFRSLLLLITYSVLLVVVLINLDVIAGGVKTLLTVCRPLLIGFAIAFVLHRPCGFFARQYEKGLPQRAKGAARPLAVVTSYVLLIGLIVALFALVIPQLVSSVQTFASHLNDYAANLQSLYDWVVSKLDLELLENVNLSGIGASLQGLLERTMNAVTSAIPQIVTITANLVSAVVTFFLAIVFSIYMLHGSDKLCAQCRRLTQTYLPKRLAEWLLRVVRLTADTFTNFVSGQLIEACILGGLCFLGMTILRFDYAPLISVIIGVSALIPVAGAYLGAVVACLLLVMIDPLEAVWFLIFLVILQQLEGNIIYPRVVGTSIGLPGLWVLAAVTIGGGLFGFPGMLLGVPVAAVLYTLLRDDLRRRVRTGGEPEPKE